MWILGFSVSFLLLLYVYIKHNDKRLTSIPPEALSFSPKRFTEEDARSAEKQFAGKSVSVKEQLPPSTGRRYIVVGGVRDLKYVYVTHSDLLLIGMIGRLCRWMDRPSFVTARRRPSKDPYPRYPTPFAP